jgi:hypothetical protein
MADPVTVFVGALGLTTKRDPARLTNDDGQSELPQAVNVDISDSARVSRRPGYVKRSSTGGHSLSRECDPVLLVSGDKLCRLEPDFKVRELATLQKPRRTMRYKQVPTGEIYFGNEIDRGIYFPETDTVTAWIADLTSLDVSLEIINQLREQYFSGAIDFAEYSRGVEDALRDTEVFHNNPLPPRHLELYRGRLFISHGSFVLYSAPWVYYHFDLAEWFIPMDSTVSMLRATVDGLYVGTQSGVFFLSGAGPDEFTVSRVSNDPPVEHTDVRVEGQNVSEDLRGDAAMFTSEKGIVLAGPSGSLIDYTKDRIDLPRALRGAGIVHRGAYVASLTV